MPQSSAQPARRRAAVARDGGGGGVSQRIVGQIRAALFRGELRPGDFLGSEAELAAHFGASRLPVREALRTLRAMGVVEVRRGAEGGAFVAQPSQDSVVDAMAVQLALLDLSSNELIDAQLAVESLAAEMAAENADAADFARLDGLIAEMAERLDDQPAFVTHSMAFHAAVVAASHSRALIAQFRMFQDILASDRQHYSGGVLTRRVLARHRKLRDLIAAGDGEGARAQIAFALRDFRRARVRNETGSLTPA
ncbi:MAG TPA: FCD domain-containing protein [Hyphomicrobiales bacterium]|nr:FCD domain-containing protein [Hyphomicrobiales bacterium]